MKVLLGLLLLLMGGFAQAASPLKAEAGVGWEYGIVGSQLSWQTPLQPLEIFATVGVEDSSQSEVSFRGGIGASVFLSKYFAISLYGGMNSRHFTYTGDKEYEFGSSTGIKIYFAGKQKPGFVLGASYIYNGEDWSPLASIAYRF